jgi:hypothetical protein
LLTLSRRELDRIVVLRQMEEGELSVSEGARRLRLGLRHTRRLLRRFEREREAAAVHGLRSRPSNRRLPDALRQRTLETAADPLYHDFGPTLLAEHLERDHGLGPLHPSTLRLWLIDEGKWQPTRRGQRHRKRRPRRTAYGELVLMDTSIHAWLEDRSDEEIVMIALIDDATSRLHARFFTRDTGAANRQLLISYLEQCGRMGAVYADQASHFQANFNRAQRRAEDKNETLTLIERALSALDIELIRALSPQAKGRVERLFRTLQDRLLKELRVAHICSVADANEFLENVFIPFWNQRFVVEPTSSVDAHRPLPEGVDLLRLFADTDERVVRNDFTFRYRNQHYQIEKTDADRAMPNTRLTIEHRLDGTTCFRWRNVYLQPTALPHAPTPPPLPERAKPPLPRPLTGAAGKPVPPEHPWRRFPVRVGRGRSLPHTPTPDVTSAPAALRSDTPALAGTT